MFEKLKTKAILMLGAATMAASTVGAEINLSALWEFITEITDNQDIIIGIIILVAVLGIVRKFGKGLGNMLNITGKSD